MPQTHSTFLIYGATGYTGSLIAREAARRGLIPILAGRDESRVRALAEELHLPYRAFSLEDPELLPDRIRDVPLLLNCAGPFIHTYERMTFACLAAGVHYVDLTGEVPVLEGVYALDAQACERGVILLPGAGLDVVPTDCLALTLKESLPDARHLRLILDLGRKQSRGTMKSSIEAIPRGGAYRDAGVLVAEKQLSEIRRLPTASGKKWTMRIPWGDISSAYRTTGIPNIEVFVTASLAEICALRAVRPFTSHLRRPAVRNALFRAVDFLAEGPGAAYRDRAQARFRGDVWNAAGGHRTAELRTPEGYALTVMTALESVGRILRGTVPPGAHTPAAAFGSGYILSFPGVELTGPGVHE